MSKRIQKEQVETIRRLTAERDSWRACVIETFNLAEEISDEPEVISVVRSEQGHSGPGWYAWHYEYPEEGSLFLGAATAIRGVPVDGGGDAPNEEK